MAPRACFVLATIFVAATVALGGCSGQGAGTEPVGQAAQGGAGAPSGTRHQPRPGPGHGDSSVQTPPVVATGPASLVVSDGHPAGFDANATGSGPLSWQWLRDGVPIAGATQSHWTLAAATLADNGARFEVQVGNAAGRTLSPPAILTVTPVAPAFGSPAGGRITVLAGTTLRLDVKVIGSQPMSLQWFRDGLPVAGATTRTFTLSPVLLSDQGSTLRLVATNAQGSETSPVWTIDVVTVPVLPLIVTGPAGQEVNEGEPARFSVDARGTPPLAYQWLRDARPIAGADGPAYSIASAGRGDDGARFSVVVSNDAGSATSASASLAVRSHPGLALLAGLPTGRGDADGVGRLAAFEDALALSQDALGNRYVADRRNSLIRRITPEGVVTTVAGVPPVRGQASTGAVDGPARQARFNSPHGLAVDGVGTIYVADTDNHLIRRISADGIVSTLAGQAGEIGSTDGPGATARFNYPGGVAIDAAGHVLVQDTANATLRRITPEGLVTTVAGVAGDHRHVDGPPGVGRFEQVRGMAVDGSGQIYVSTGSTRTIRRISPDGTITTVAGAYGAPEGNEDGAGIAARFTQPAALATDAAGHVYVVDELANRIRRLAPDGRVTTVHAGPVEAMLGGIAADAAGGLTVADGARIVTITHPARLDLLAGSNPTPGDCLDGEARSARLGRSLLLAASPAPSPASSPAPSPTTPPAGANPAGSAVFLADPGARNLRRLAPDAGTVATVLGHSGAACSAAAPLDAVHPRAGGLAVDAAGDLYLSDVASSTLVKIGSEAAIVLIAGTPGQSGSADGPALAARFRNPGGLAFDPAGNLWVGDGSTALRRISPDGTVTTPVGSNEAWGIVDGIGTDARLAGTASLAFDGSGNLYVSHPSAHVIRRITPALEVTTIGLADGAGHADGQGADVRFNTPGALAPAAGGGLLVADEGNGALRHLGPDGRVTTLAGTPDGRIGVQLGALPGRLHGVSSLATGADGTVYLALPGGIVKLTLPPN